MSGPSYRHKKAKHFTPRRPLQNIPTRCNHTVGTVVHKRSIDQRTLLGVCPQRLPCQGEDLCSAVTPGPFIVSFKVSPFAAFELGHLRVFLFWEKGSDFAVVNILFRKEK